MEKGILMALCLGILEPESAKTIPNWRLILREWSNKTGEDFKGDLCSFRVHNMFWGQNVPYLPLTLKTLSVIVNYFVSVDVILLP